MAIQTPSTITPATGIEPQPPTDERDTATLDPAAGLRQDALAALDHRARRRAIPAQRAFPGQYLALDDDEGSTFLLPLDSKIIHVGRATSADLRLDDAHVSRRHAIIVRYGRHVRVLDDRSLAGTFVNGLRVTATDLTDGDVIRVGPIVLTYTVIR
jgi:pSer/pThr/pTyr-binding forkhead associated (FHA) protein